jgi:hypothetical protein
MTHDKHPANLHFQAQPYEVEKTDRNISVKFTSINILTRAPRAVLSTIHQRRCIDELYSWIYKDWLELTERARSKFRR